MSFESRAARVAHSLHSVRLTLPHLRSRMGGHFLALRLRAALQREVVVMAMVVPPGRDTNALSCEFERHTGSLAAGLG